MRCPQCDYRLWNIATRSCPECGRPFKPSDFEFLPNTVEFCCPHCDQPYYGQDEKGHLAPPEFDCLQCGRHVHMDDMLLRPGPGLKEEQTTTPINPWFDTHGRAFFARYFAAVWQGIRHPALASLGVPANASRSRSVYFLCMNACVFPAISGVGLMLLLFVANFLFFGGSGGTGGTGGSGGSGGSGGGPMMSMFMMGSVVVLIPSMVILGLMVSLGVAMVWAMSIQTLLHLLACRPHARLKRTYDAVALTSGVHLLSSIPCCGFYLIPLSGLAWVITAAIAVRGVQRTPAVRTILATLALPALVLALVIYWFNFSSSTYNPRAQTGSVTAAVLDHARQHNGNPPAHALALVADLRLNSWDLTNHDIHSASSPQGIPVDAIKLDAFDNLPRYDQQARVNRIVSAMPPGIIAHRLGDYVFTYHGLNLASTPPDAWVVIASPDPDQNQQPPTSYQVGRANGSVRRYAAPIFPQELAKQNQLRATLGLAPLPDPQTITHAKPASASNAPPNFAATQPQTP